MDTFKEWLILPLLTNDGGDPAADLDYLASNF